MRPLDLDFLRTSTRARWLGWVLLAGGAFAIGVIERAASLAEQGIEDAQAKLVSARRTADKEGLRRGSGQSGIGAEVRVAHAAMQRLSTPWPALFDAVEAAQSPGVRLTSLEPDAGARTAVLGGEARDYLAVLNYVNALESKGGLTRVHLVRHELRAREAGFPIAFGVQLSWGAAHLPGARAQPVVQGSGS